MTRHYRICFIDLAGRLAGCQDFSASTDGEAELAGWLVFDACSDECSAYQIWDERRCLVDRRFADGRPPGMTEEVSSAVDIAQELEEALVDSRHAVARSRRMLWLLGLQKDEKWGTS